ncbi:SGNH/GDSL hydrolase family protein [Portibacter marinus]|uniref:SGNH/GDSL hydrolase family protein n=1 Tax=Portibacter marinus TaxID=2898660 RepID=UPI001F17E09D|nr:SGNH/GDSL hydrolase family protein [Portibacter marinus]
MKYFLVLLFVGQWFNVTGQWHTVKDHLEGQGWKSEIKDPFTRLPERVKDDVPTPLWNLSQHSTGLMFRFRASTSSITVRYQVSDQDYGMRHMPMIGKSGLDLYAISSDGQELWCAGKARFGDTIVYQFQKLDPNDRYHDQGREYRLYLPPYNKVEWMEIKTDEGSYFEVLPAREDAPIVVYGTSIAQGAHASRPGMIWPTILSREMDRPLINLGFSGNGQLSPAILNLMTEIDAKIYILDCLPNLGWWHWERVGLKDSIDLKNLVIKAVKILHDSKPEVPILLVEHAGYTEGQISSSRKEDYEVLNRMQKEAFIELRHKGLKHLYYLTREEIGLSQDAMTDGTHPTDLGMYQYATAYERKVREILHEQEGVSSTSKPVRQYREPGNYDWEKRHLEIIAMNKSEPPQQVFLANSIVHFWGGEPEAKIAREAETWNKHFTPSGLRNMAFGWDRIENVRWRVHHGALDGFEAEKVLVMIGTNNLHLNNDQEIIEGLEYLLRDITVRQPEAELILMGLLPRRGYVDRIRLLNFKIAQLAANLNLVYKDVGHVFLSPDQSLNETLFSDGLHPNREGYLKLSPFIQEIVGH